MTRGSPTLALLIAQCPLCDGPTDDDTLCCRACHDALLDSVRDTYTIREGDHA